MSKLVKSIKHSHYWIEDGVLYESYYTIRGLRFLPLIDVPNMPDESKCSEECIKYITLEYCS